MNLCIDQGNSKTKIGIFENYTQVYSSEFVDFTISDLKNLVEEFNIDACIFSSVRKDNPEFLRDIKDCCAYFINLSHQTPIPVENAYRTPETLGRDRLAAVVGAAWIYPGRNILVIDAGTAITYDFVEAGSIYRGGNIAPGLDLRLRALHEFTGKLPLVSLGVDEMQLGNDTRTAIASGVLWGAVYEIEGYVSNLMQNYPDLLVLLTGGSTFYFDGKVKSAIFAEKNLVLIGLNRILHYNVQK